MKIHDFSSTLNFTVVNSRNDGSFETEKYFDEDMQMTASYIIKICEEHFQDKEVSIEELGTFLLEDYNQITDETFFSAEIYRYSMKYLAIKYLETHRSEIPTLKQEIKERNIVFNENEIYTDNFHENLLEAVLAMEEDFECFCDNMAEKNPECLDEIKEFESKYGKEEGFKKFCEKYSNMKMFPATVRRAFISYAHFIIFGIEGIDENLSPKSQIIKYKKKYSLKDYATTLSERMEEGLIDELVNSIISLAYQLDRFGELAKYIENHAEKMNRICLPGLKYVEKEEETADNPSVIKLFTEEKLRNLPLDVLLRMNSFYNNRFAKIISAYSMSLFILDETNSALDVLKGNTLSKQSFSKENLDNLFLKYQVLSSPIKSFYNASQRDIENENQTSLTQKQKIVSEESTGKKQVVLNIDYFIKEVKMVWKKEYKKYFDDRLPGVKNDLKLDLLLVNMLYNPVFLSYKFKDLALKSEYAYMNYLSQKNSNMNLNFGVVLSSQDENFLDSRNIFIASDGGLNFPNRLHTKKEGFIDFVKSYTGSPLIRVYEGIEDFEYFGEYITAPLLLPITRKQEKYLKDLSKGKSLPDDTRSAINPGNEDMVNHIFYCIDRTRVMKNHRTKYTTFDKKGNPKEKYMPLVRYVDSRDGQIYTLNEYGNLVNKNGEIIQANGEKSQDERSNFDG